MPGGILVRLTGRENSGGMKLWKRLFGSSKGDPLKDGPAPAPSRTPVQPPPVMVIKPSSQAIKAADPNLRPEFRCSNCNARTYDRTSLCGICASNPMIATTRRVLAEELIANGLVNPKCGKCGISEAERVQQLQNAERSGVSLYMTDWPLLLYCDHCNKHFCRDCQIDLGFHSGCPLCKKDLEQ